MKYLSPEVAPDLYKSTIWPCIEYSNVWAGAPSCYLEFLEKLQKQICRTLGPSLTATVEPLTHRRNVACLTLLYSHNFHRPSSELVQLVLLPYFRGTRTRYSDIFYYFSVTIPRCHKNVYVNSLFLEQLDPGIPCLLEHFLITVSFKTDFPYALTFLGFFSCNSMPCSSLHGVTFN